MKKRLDYYLCRSGYKKLSAATEEYTVYFTLETGYVNAVLLVDLIHNGNVTKEGYEEYKKKIRWRFLDSGCVETHVLTIFLTDDVKKAQNITLEDRFEWILLQEEETLLIEDGKVEDFYGLKRLLQNCLQEHIEIDPTWISPLECDSKGEPYFHSIWQRPVVNHGLFVINLLLFTCCILTGNLLYDMGTLSYQQVLDGEYYRIFSSMFLHADMSHIAGNMLILYYLGDIVERALGHVKYLILYLFSGVLAAFASMGFSYLSGEYVSSLGASGAIFGMVGALLWVSIRNHGHIEIMSVRKVIFLISYSLYSGFIGTNVDNAAHVGGLAGGFLLAIILYHKKKRRKIEK